MPLDVVDLRSFYHTPLGLVAGRIVGQILRARWENCTGLSVLGIGYATPYLEVFREEALRTIAFMPAEQGVLNWPGSGITSSALVDATALPLPDSCVDRVLIVHGLEVADHPADVLEEVWRVLSPGGRVVAVAPNRRGLWARSDTTPFGQGQPFSRGQLRALFHDALFSPVHWRDALYLPPSGRRPVLRLAPIFERIGERLSLPGAGVCVIEATKQLYRPILSRKTARRQLPALEPALAPGPGRTFRGPGISEGRS